MAAAEGPFARWGTIFGGLGVIVAIVSAVLAVRSIPPAGNARPSTVAPGSVPTNGDPRGGSSPATQNPTGGGTAGPQGGGGGGGSTPGGGSGQAPTPARTTPAPPYVRTSRFVPFSKSYGEFAYDASGTRLTITSTGDYWERGGILTDTNRCTVTVDFDLRLEEPGYQTDAYWGFGVLPRGHLQDDQPAGLVLVIDGPSDEFGALAAFSSEPIPGHGGKGFDWHTIADPRQERHITVSMTGNSMHAVVAGEQIDASFGDPECGSLMFFTWGGATAHVNNILIS